MAVDTRRTRSLRRGEFGFRRLTVLYVLAANLFPQFSTRKQEKGWPQEVICLKPRLKNQARQRTSGCRTCPTGESFFALPKNG
jgi:hypothetical protein